MSNLVGKEDVPSSIVARISIDNTGITADVTLGFIEPVRERICLWFNPGLKIIDILTQSTFKQTTALTKDPDRGIIDVSKTVLEIDKPVYGIKVVYHGELKPLIHGPLYMNKDRNICVVRSTALWYPYTISCHNLLGRVFVAEHYFGVIRAKIPQELSIAASLEYQGVEDGEHVYVGTKTATLEYVIAPFKTNSYSDEKTIHVYSIGEHVYSPKQIHDMVTEIESVIEELIGVKSPYRQYNVVFLSNVKEFSSGSLLVFNKELVKTEREFKIQLVRNLVSTICSSYIKPCSPNTLWFTHAFTKYMATLVLDKLGILKQKSKVKKLMRQAKELVRTNGYKPPTCIQTPLTDIEVKSWDVVGEALLHEIAKEIGYSKFNEILSMYLRKGVNTPMRYCINWGELSSKLESVSKKAVRKIEKYIIP